MMNLKDISKAIEQIAQEKGLEAEKVLEAVESSIAAAYKKEYGNRGEVIRSKFNTKSGELKFWQVKTVVDESTIRIVEEESFLPGEGETGHLAAKRPAAKEKMEDENGEPLLPRYNPERHIMFPEAKKISAVSGPAPGGQKGVKV